MSKFPAMDSHYFQVMNKRDQIQTNGTRLYFAYSTILDQAAFQEWAIQHSYQFFTLPEGKVAQAPDMDLVFDFPSRWWGGLVAGLTDKKDSSVYGVLFEITDKDWPIIQHKEGAITGMCIEKSVQVNVGGQTVTATAFVTNPQRAQTEGEISHRFIAALVQGATASGLPADYVKKLNSFLK